MIRKKNNLLQFVFSQLKKNVIILLCAFLILFAIVPALMPFEINIHFLVFSGYKKAWRERAEMRRHSTEPMFVLQCFKKMKCNISVVV